MSTYQVTTNDAALLEEVSVFLNTSGLLLGRTNLESLQEDIRHVNSNERTTTMPSLPILPSIGEDADVASGASDTSSYNKNDDVLTRKSRTAREKEMIRKRRYQRRLKDERVALQRELSSLLLQLHQAHRGKKLAATHTFAQQDPAKLERTKLRQAEEQQKRLVEAISVQASYLAKLRELLPSQLEIAGDTAMARRIAAWI